MLKIGIFMDCHGGEILTYLLQCPRIKENYDIFCMHLNHYVLPHEKFYNNTKLDEKDIEIIQTADVLILQVIEKDRNFLNNNEVVKFCKHDCQIIKIPHYRNSIYYFKTLEGFEEKHHLIGNWKLPQKIDINNISETINIIKNQIEIMNNYNYDKNQLENAFTEKINEFQRIDNLSDIKMHDYYIQNFKKNRLFQGRGYPSSIFFHELTNRILERIGLEKNKEFVDYYFAENTGEPIPNYWHKYCNFEFNNTYYTYGHIEIQEYEWYYILLLSNNPDICNREENINILNKIR